MYTSFVLLSLVSASVALNDWTKPCINECSWDIPQANATSSGSVRVWGDKPGSISDITGAADWMILDCDPNKMAQDIRLVCKEGQSDKCKHLMDGGPEGKLIRLPPKCAKGPFAVVGKSWVHANQALPPSLQTKLQKRGIPPPTVRGLSIHMDWSALPPKTGNVNIELLAFNAPGYNGDTGFSPTVAGRHLATRGFFDKLKDIGKKIVDAGKKVVDTVKKGAETVVKDVSKATEVNVDKKVTKAIDANFDKNLLDLSVQCSKADLGVKVDLSSRSHADVSLGAIAKGTILPPKFEDFALFAGLTADLNGRLNINVQASGVVDSGQKTVFEVGIPGFDIPGIFRVGPSFQVNVQAKANLDVAMNMGVDIAYKVDGALLFFPESDKHKSTKNFKPADSPLKLAADAGVASKMSLEAHVIPKILVGMSAFGKLAQADIFVQLDASATLGLSLDASKSAGKAPVGAPAIVGSPKILAPGIGAAPAGTPKTPVKPATKGGKAPKPVQVKLANQKEAPTTLAKAKPAPANAAPAKAKQAQAKAAPKQPAQAKPAAVMKKPRAVKAKASAPKVASKPAAKAPPKVQTKGPAKAPAPAPGKKAPAGTRPIGTPGVFAAGGAPTPPQTVSNPAGGVSGCVDLTGNLAVTAGANANFFSFFNKGTQVTFFNQKFNLFKKCFGAGQKRSLGSTDTIMYSRPRELLLRKRAALSCPVTGGLTSPQSLVNQVLTGILPI